MRAVAIVNASSRGVDRRRTAFERACRTHFTHSLDEARAVVRAEIKGGVDLVVLGGGDGTFVMTLALIAEACRGEGRPEPAIGVLRLGSGNALARALGAGDDPVEDLARFARGEATWQPRRMIDVLGMRAPFAGVGLDAVVLADNEAISRVVDRVPLARRVLGGPGRYALSVALRSIPRFALGNRPRVRVIAAAEAQLLAPDGTFRATIPEGSLMWEGECTLVAAATIPYFGFGMKMFPFAELREDRFHLRCGDPGVLEVLRNTPAAFRGGYFSDRVRDFLCERISVVSDDKPLAIEAGGELVDQSHQVEFGLSEPVTLAALRPR